MRLPIVQHAAPRSFGLGPPLLVFSFAVGLLVLGAVLLAVGSVPLGVIAIVLAVCLLPAFLAGARRWPATPIARAGPSAAARIARAGSSTAARIARAGSSTATRVHDETGAAVSSISTWSQAGRDTVRLRKEQFQLRRELDAKIRELGHSVFDEDGRADELKAAAKELDGRIAANQRELQRTIAAARRRERKGRAAVVATEVIRPEPEAEADAEAEAEAEPTAEDVR